LEERTRERVPSEWAGTLSNLANCLAALAKLSATPATHLQQAIAHMQNAVAGYQQVGDNYMGSIVEKRLAELKAQAH
jgi:hypothetical protein